MNERIMLERIYMLLRWGGGHGFPTDCPVARKLQLMIREIS